MLFQPVWEVSVCFRSPKVMLYIYIYILCLIKGF